MKNLLGRAFMAFAFALALVFALTLEAAHAAIPPQKFQQGPRYNVSMRIGLKGAMPFSVNTVARAGKKSSVTEISADGQTETFVQVTPRKAFRDSKAGLNFDVTVKRTVKGQVKASEKIQVFAFENQESESRLNAQSRGRQDLSVAVLANPI